MCLGLFFFLSIFPFSLAARVFLRQRRELCFSPILAGTTKKRDLLRHHRRGGIQNSVGLGATLRRRREDSRCRTRRRLSTPKKKRLPTLCLQHWTISPKKSCMGSFSATFEGWVLQHFFPLCKKDLSRRRGEGRTLSSARERRVELMERRDCRSSVESFLLGNCGEILLFFHTTFFFSCCVEISQRARFPVQALKLARLSLCTKPQIL